MKIGKGQGGLHRYPVGWERIQNRVRAIGRSPLPDAAFCSEVLGETFSIIGEGLGLLTGAGGEIDEADGTARAVGRTIAVGTVDG